MAADAVTGEMAPPQGGEPFRETSEIVGGCPGGARATENFVMQDTVSAQNNSSPVPGRADRSSEPQSHRHTAEEPMTNALNRHLPCPSIVRAWVL